MSNTESIIDLFLRKYRRCSSYIDSGVCTVDYGDFGHTTQFKTHFRRPQYFRFEWQDFRGGKPVTEVCGVWSDGEHTYKRTSKAMLFPHLHLALGGHTGAGSGIAKLIASLLITDVRIHSERPFELDSLQEGPIQQGEPEPCHFFTSQDEKGADVRLWIAKSNHAIKRFEIDQYTTVEQYERSERELIEREKVLAAKLNREESLPTSKQYRESHYLRRFDYTAVEFDAPIDEKIFQVPWQNNT